MKKSVFLSHLLEISQRENIALETVLQQTRDMGLEAVEVFLDDLLKDEIREAIEHDGMKVSGIYAFLDFAHQPYEGQADDLLSMAKKVNAGCVMPLPGRVNDGEDRLLLREKMVDGMNMVCSQAAEQGIQVVLEDFGLADAPYGQIEEIEWFLHQVPALGFALDTGNFVYHGQDVLEAYERFRERIRHVHLKDHALSPDYGELESVTPDGKEFFPCPVGSGYLPMRELISRLRDDGYEGYMALEQFGLRETREGLRMAADWLKTV